MTEIQIIFIKVVIKYFIKEEGIIFQKEFIMIEIFIMIIKIVLIMMMNLKIIIIKHLMLLIIIIDLKLVVIEELIIFMKEEDLIRYQGALWREGEVVNN